MAKDRLGTKWECFSCGSKFYDFGKSPVLCPHCGADQDSAERPPVEATPAEDDVDPKDLDVEEDEDLEDDEEGSDDEDETEPELDEDGGDEGRPGLEDGDDFGDEDLDDDY